MARSSSGSGLIAPYAPGQENAKYNVLFDESSTESTSHVFVVDNNFVRVAAFNLAPGDVVTIEQVTGLAAGDKVADYAPIHGPVKLYWNSATDQRTSYILERAGRYRAKLSSGVGLVHVYAIQYFIENEASQDIADALYAVLNQILAPNPCTIGAVIPADTTANNVVVSLNDSNCLVHQQFISSDPTNLLQLKPDGAYYGIAPPINFTNQYVSSSTGDDNSTTPNNPLTPLKTIQKAISNLPDGTAGNIFLLAGDVFHTYPTATGDVINTLTFQQGAAQAATLNIGDRKIQVFPYNDTAINDIVAYNTANNTGYNPYIAQQTNFPEIRVTLSQSTNSGGIYVVLGFIVGGLGSIRFNAIKFVMGTTGGNTTNYFHSGIVGNGDVAFQGGYVVLSEIPVIGNATGAGQMNATIFETPTIVLTAFALTQKYAVLGNQILMVTSPPIAPGSLIVPSLSYTNTGDTAEQTGGFPSTTPYPGASYSYVALGGAGSASLWQGIVIYDSATRSFRRVFTDIDIQV